MAARPMSVFEEQQMEVLRTDTENKKKFLQDIVEIERQKLEMMRNIFAEITRNKSD